MIKINSKVIVGLALLTVLFIGTYAFSTVDPYLGGNEMGAVFKSVTNDGITFNIYGQRNWPSDDRSDPDGNFDVAAIPLGGSLSAYIDSIQKAGISLEMGYPYYLKEVAPNMYVASDKAVITRSYEVPYTVGNESYLYKYSLIPYAFDVILKTNADRFQLKVEDVGLANYGWDFESTPTDISAMVNFGLSPWRPSGLWNESYTIVGGWAGIIQANVYDKSYGVLQNERLEQEMAELPDGASYDTATIIQNLHSDNAAVNMWKTDTNDAYQAIDFDNPNGLVNVISAINIQLNAKLGAGATYTADFWGHTNALAVRNVYVTYRIVMKIITTIDMHKLVVEGTPITVVEEGSTAGDPPPIPVYSATVVAWAEFWAEVAEFFSNPMVIFYMILIVAVVVIIGYLILRMRFGK